LNSEEAIRLGGRKILKECCFGVAVIVVEEYSILYRLGLLAF